MSQAVSKPASAALKAERPAILCAHGVKKSYKMGEETLLILKNVDLNIRDGEFLAIEGRSGSGKSTLLHILGGLDAPDSGRLEYQGKQYAASPPELLYRTPFAGILAVPKLTRMVVWTAIESVLILLFLAANLVLLAKIFIPFGSLVVIALAFWRRREQGLFVSMIIWILLWLALLTQMLFRMWWIGPLAGITAIILFFVYLAVNAYVVERPVCRLRNEAFGFVFQFYHLLPELNVLENTMLAPMIKLSVLGFRARARTRARAIEVLTQIGLAHRLKHKPSQLSGGERQRVAIARALMSRPKVLFADEPTGNLDFETGRQIMGVIEKLHREDGQTVIMVTHDRSLACMADRVLVLRNGKLERPDEKAEADKTPVLDYH